jgi:hypothetical protein
MDNIFEYLIKILNIHICMEHKRSKESEGHLITGAASKLGDNFSSKGKESFIKERYRLLVFRNKIFNEIKRKIDEVFQNMEKPEITVKVNIS